MTRPRWLPDPLILIPVAVLIVCGLLSNYSTSHAEGGEALTHFNRQLIWIVAGTFFLILGVSVPPRIYQMLAYPIYGFTVFSLMLVLVAGKSSMGATRWFDLGPFHFQPSEIAKIAIMLGLARFLSDHPRELDKPWVTIAAIGMVMIPMGLVLVQPDLGTSLVFPVMLFCMLAWARVPAVHLLFMLAPVLAVLTSWHAILHLAVMFLIIAGVAFWGRRLIPTVLVAGLYLMIGTAAPKLWNHLHPYQQKRLLTFLDPEADPLGSAYQLIQSKIAIGSGGITGKGFLHGTQTQLKFLPEGHTDFIFSAWAEEVGFIGAFLVVGCFFTLFVRGVMTANKCHNPFNALCAIGISTILIFQALANLLMTVGFLPVTGIPLPLMSYGGSSMITTLFAIGLLMGIELRWREY